MKFKNSEKIYEKAINIIPGGVNSPVRAFKSVKRSHPIFIKKEQVLKFGMRIIMNILIISALGVHLF